MDIVLLNDAARGVHLLGLALGLGFAIKADHIAFSFLVRPLNAVEMKTLDACHRTVWFGLSLFWISGAVLLWLRTGFVLDEFSKKLLLKVAVVSILTGNAVLIGRYAMPTLISWHHARLGELPLNSRCLMAVVGGVSAASWASALTLGVFSAMKVMDPMRMYEVIGAVYATGIVGALLIAIIAPLFAVNWARRKSSVIETNDPEYQLQNLRPAS